MTPKVDASAAIEKQDTDGRFRRLHESFLFRGKAGPIGVLFVGDSITQGWSGVPQIWQRYYAQMQPANFGSAGDQTQHVIWRIANGELDGISPRVVVLMLGTNNTGSHTAAEIAAANRKIVGMIRAKIPAAKVLLLGVLPRGSPEDADAARRREIIRGINAELARLDDGRSVRYLDMTAKFLGEDGKIPSNIMPDQLHLSAAGYQIWADAMQPLLAEMMK